MRSASSTESQGLSARVCSKQRHLNQVQSIEPLESRTMFDVGGGHVDPAPFANTADNRTKGIVGFVGTKDDTTPVSGVSGIKYIQVFATGLSDNIQISRVDKGGNPGFEKLKIRIDNRVIDPNTGKQKLVLN